MTFARSAGAPSRLIPTSLGLSQRPVPDLLAEESAPLIFAAEDSLCPNYLRANISNELLAGWTSGNPNNLTLRELRERTLPLASVRDVRHAAHRQGERELAQQRATASVVFESAAATNGSTAVNVPDTVNRWRNTALTFSEPPRPPQ